MLTPLTPDLYDRFMGVANALSPENLHADGERSRSAAAKLERTLRSRWKTLEGLAGRRVSEDEVFTAWLANRRHS